MNEDKQSQSHCSWHRPNPPFLTLIRNNSPQAIHYLAML